MRRTACDANRTPEQQPYSAQMDLQRFQGRTALVTGAASGIGRATARRLAAEGATVYATDVNADAVAATAADVDDLPGTIVPAVGDVGDESAVVAMVTDAVAELGKLDVVANIAGVLSFSHTHELPLAEWERLLRINLTGTFLVCREALPHLVASRGVIVNIASTAGHKGQPWSAAYAASKGGVLQLTRSIAVEYAHAGIRANTISPGAVSTPIMDAFHLPEGADAKLLTRVMPLGPYGTPEGIAAAVAYVASDEAAHMNGADVLLDGATLA